MARRLLAAAAALLALLILAGCRESAPVEIPKAPPKRVEIAVAPPALAPPAAPVLVALPLPPPKPPAPASEPLIPSRAVDLIIAFEVGSPEVYTRKYTRPVWPGAASGVTIGLGYDLGHQRAEVIALDWQRHPHVARLQTAAGITGPLAKKALQQFADIAVEYGFAREVFDQTSLVEHYRVARRVFVPAQFDQAPPLVKGALTSLVFNRGGSMAGPGRVEYRVIRDTCLAAPASSGQCVAAQIRAMKRLWRGSSIERGMDRRREAEAVLAEAA